MTVDELSNEHARGVLKEILARPEFTANEFFRRIMDFFLGNKSWGGGFLSAESIITIIKYTLIVIGLLLVIYLLRSMLPFWRLMLKDVNREIVPANTLSPPQANELLLKADAKSAQKDFRGAVRDIYLAVLAELDKRNLIVYKTAKTNSEYLQEVKRQTAGSAGLTANFQAMVDLFEHKWYGLENCSLEDFTRCKELYATLLYHFRYER